jgi:hypothetical protein
MLVSKQRFPSLDTPCAGGRPSTTNDGMFPTVSPGVPTLLAVGTLRKTSLVPIGIHTDENVAKVGTLKISCDFAVLGNVIRNKGRFFVFPLSEDGRRVVINCLTLITSKPRFTSP